MPLRITHGQQISPQIPPPTVELPPPQVETPTVGPQPGAGIAHAAAFVSRGRLRRFSQKKSEFCWAACAQMVATYYRVSRADQDGYQCELAEVLFGAGGCRASKCNSALCNKPCTAGAVADLYGQLGINAFRHGRPIGFRQVVEEIQRRRPVEVGLQWTGGGRHLVIIHGWSPSDEPDDGFVKVNDPLDDHQPDGEIRHSELLAAYGEGFWIDTWTDLRRMV